MKRTIIAIECTHQSSNFKTIFKEWWSNYGKWKFRKYFDEYQTEDIELKFNIAIGEVDNDKGQEEVSGIILHEE